MTAGEKLMPYPVGEAILATLGLLVSIGLGNPGCLLRFRSVLGKAPRAQPGIPKALRDEPMMQPRISARRGHRIYPDRALASCYRETPSKVSSVNLKV
eukprot:3016618-Rhodomonas_salina.1